MVVYKVDRLTRSLADFAGMVELFDSHSVSFVAVTQQFNTTTSKGRLTLNVLLSSALVPSAPLRQVLKGEFSEETRIRTRDKVEEAMPYTKPITFRQLLFAPIDKPTSIPPRSPGVYIVTLHDWRGDESPFEKTIVYFGRAEQGKEPHLLYRIAGLLSDAIGFTERRKRLRATSIAADTKSGERTERVSLSACTIRADCT